MLISMKKFLLTLLIIGIIIGIGLGITSVWIKGITNKIFIKKNTATNNTSVNTLQNDFDTNTPINIALLGYGGGNHDGAYLTDSMIVVHIDPKVKKIFLVSIPRDLWVKIPTNGTEGSYSKINAAYAYGLDDSDYPNKQAQFKGTDGGGRLAEYMVSQVMGIPIDYFVGMDFSGFKHTIDTLGGVDINVNPAFTDTEYPIDGKEADLCGHQATDIPTLDAQATVSAVETIYPCRYENLHFDAGMQHMDGERALSYVRSRHSMEDGTDFGRAKRQRNLIIAVKQKIFSVGFISQIIPFMSSLGDDLRTDLSIDDVKTLLQNATTIDKYQVSTLALTDQNYLIDTISSDGQDILEPKDGIDNFSNIHRYISDQFSGKVEPVAPVIQIENGTTTVGLATSANTQVKRLNLNTLDPQNAVNQNYIHTQITVYDKNVDQNALSALQKAFHVSNVIYSTSAQSAYNVLVIVGQDYQPQISK